MPARLHPFFACGFWHAVFFVRGFPQHVAATPHGFEVVFAAGGVGQFFAQIAEEDVNDFNLRPVAATVKVVQDHFLGQCHALAQTQKFENLILLAGEVHVCAVPERTGDLETSYHVEERSVLNNLEGWPPLSIEMAEAAKSEADRVKYLELARAWLTEAISLSPQNENIERPGKSH